MKTTPITPDTPCTAFAGSRRLSAGPLRTVSSAVRRALSRGHDDTILIFHDATGEVIDLGRGESAPVEEPRGPGRPKLGVVAREVTLLPRHWEWLNSQPGGASVALRKLVEDARKTHAHGDRVRRSQEACYRFVSTMAGNEPGYEESLRALFAGKKDRFFELTNPWPEDVRTFARALAADALD